MRLPSSKNVGPFLAFTKEWFVKRQAVLLWFLNTPGIRVWSRWILRIHRDIPIDRDIDKILPNCFSFGRKVLSDGRIEITTDFRCHPKFSKRIYYAFRPIWWALHYWDELFADRFAPELSFGFDTLTAYPDPDTETSTVDGRTGDLTNDEAWDTKVNPGSGTFAGDADANDVVMRIQSGLSTLWRRNYRGIFLFDTSSIGSGSTISATVMSLNGTAKSDGLSTTPDIDIYTSTPASNTALVSGDYTQLGSTSQTGSPIAYSSFSTSGYNDFTFDATGRGNVSKTSISKFGARNANHDVANSEPNRPGNSLESTMNIDFADQTGTTSDPKLVVTYTTGGPTLKAGSDSLKAGLSEDPGLLGTLSLSESVKIGLTEVAPILASFGASESTPVNVTEVSELAVVIALADQLGVSTTEASDILGLLNLADQLGIGVTEAHSILNKFTVAENLPIGLAEAGAVFVTLTPVTDGLSIGLTDSSRTVNVVITGSDSISVGLTEAANILARLSVSDSLQTALVDALNSLIVTLSTSDSTAVIILDSGTVVDVTPGGVVSIDVTDSLKTVLEDDSLILGLLSVAESLPAELTEVGTQAIAGVNHRAVLIATAKLLAPIHSLVQCSGVHTVKHPDYIDYPTLILADGPALYWRLGETTGTVANDEVGSTDGTYAGGYTLSQAGPIIYGGNSAVAFDGVDGEVSVGSVPAIEFGTNDLTVEFWMKSSGPTGAQSMMVNKGGGSGRFWINQLSDRVSANCFFGGAKDFYTPFITTINDNKWHHIVVTFDRDGVTKVYVDGVKGPTETDISSASADSWDSSSDLEISSGIISRFTGSIDELALYSTLLSQERIQAHYRTGIATRTGKKFSLAVA